MRLIDADALKENAIHYSETEYHFAHDAVTVDDIDDAPTIAAPRWVRCEDERPEDLRVVIIHKEWDGEITLGYSYPGFGEEMKLWMCLKTPYNLYEVPWVGAGHVDYWMPLPEPPKEGE